MDEHEQDYIAVRRWVIAEDDTVVEPFTDGTTAVGWHWRFADGSEWYSYLVNTDDEAVLYEGPFGYSPLDREVIRVSAIRGTGPAAG